MTIHNRTDADGDGPTHPPSPEASGWPRVWGMAERGKVVLPVVFIVGVAVWVAVSFAAVEHRFVLAVAAMVGAYMAMNIGANDVANNVGPAVGSLALTMGGAIAIAAVCEAAGALIAGGDVVSTVKNGIIDPVDLVDPNEYVWVMLGALFGAALWLNVATWFRAPVSTTHSIVGGVAGAAIAAAGFGVVNWGSLLAIVSSWVVSPVMGGVIAAALLFMLKRVVFFSPTPIEQARRVVPAMIALMAWSFTTYLLLKGLAQVVEVALATAVLAGLAVGLGVWALAHRLITRAAPRLSPDRDGVNRLFTVPLICAAALLSFAHGANDVANAVGPLAGIVDVLALGRGAGEDVAIPLWVMVIGAVGISMGLALFGPALIRTVGSEITELDRSRAFCIAFSAGLTVIVASQLGLPISSTHVALGAVFGVGFLREYLDQRLGAVVEDVLATHEGDPSFARVEAVMDAFRDAPLEEKQRILKELKQMGPEVGITKAQRKELKRALKRQLVSRRSLWKIAAAWVITVPVSAVLAGLFFLLLQFLLSP